jgi:hypothetical protein
MAERGVEEFVDKNSELLVERVGGHESGIEQEAASIRGGSGNRCGFQRFGEERERTEEWRNIAEVKDEKREVEGGRGSMGGTDTHFSWTSLR